MDDSNDSDVPETCLTSSVGSILGIKGSLRFRAHGSTQKAHIILRRVTSSEDSSDGDSASKVVRFTLIAHKRIEVRPGKELLLMLESDDGQFGDRPVVLEGDLKSPGDTPEEEENVQAPDKEEVFAPPIEEAIPPKMRRAWTRKFDDSFPVIPRPERPVVTLNSIGIQTEPLYVSKSTQGQLLFRSRSSQTSTLFSSASVQVDSPLPARISAAAQTVTQTDFVDANVASKSIFAEVDVIADSEPFISIGKRTERSLSPMELDSPPDSPFVSAPELAPLSPHSPIYSPTLSIASSSGAQDMQLSPIERSQSALSESPHLTNGMHGSIPSAVSADQSTPATPTNMKSMVKPIVRSAKPPIANPFVSGGFVTDFGAPVDEGIRKIKIETSTPKLALIKSDVLPEPLSKPSPATSSQSVKMNMLRSPPGAENAIASSSKLPPTKLPTKPMHHLRLLSGRALEKSPASYIGASEETNLPPDPKALVYIPPGPSSNPLGIRPSLGASNSIVRSISKLPPSAPKTLAIPAPAPTKKRLVVGAEWRPFVKGANGNGLLGDIPPTSSPMLPPTTASVVPSKGMSQVASYHSPSPPSAAPPPLPSSATENKWKRVVSDISSSPTTTSANVPTTPCLPPKTGTMQRETTQQQQKSPLLVKTQSIPLKDRIGPSPTTTPTLPELPTTNGRDLRSRISGVAPLSLQTTPVANSVTTSPTSTLVSRSPAIPSSKASPATTTISPTLTHPLPPKPPLPVRSVKRERPKSPEYTSRKKQKRVYKWPTVDSSFSAKLSGEGQLGVRSIAFNSDGSHFAISCNDRTIRIWDNQLREEIARLSHNSPVVAVAWMDGDSGVVSLAEDGIVSKWTKSGINHWQWAKVLDAGQHERRGDDDNICMAYMRDRIAVSYPRIGVKVWIWSKATWQAQRSILRQNVTAIKFIDDGGAIIGGTRDGVLWHSEIPNGTLRAYSFLSSRIQSLDVTPSSSHVVVGLGMSAILVGIRRPDNQRNVEQAFTCKETEARASQSCGFGAVFATDGQAVLFGSVEGCVLVWDRKKAVIVYGLEHGEDDTIQAVASFNGPTNREGYLITGTKSGQLSWWSQPVAAPQ